VSQIRVAVGASRAWPSVRSQRTSSAPWVWAQRRAARFSAYDSVLAEASDQGGRDAMPESAVIRRMPSRRSRRAAAGTAATVA
jgi:hypothetical protein